MTGEDRAVSNDMRRTAAAMRFQATCLAGGLLLAAAAGGADYMKDFDFLAKSVAGRAAALKAKKIDWPAVCARLKPRFQSCASDKEHIANVMELLAALGDSHTGVLAPKTGWDGLPSKWDGLFGGGLWFGWERGRVMLRGVMPGHALGKTLPPGSALIEIAGEPAWLVLEREKRRITRHQGSSSDHSLFSSMGNRLLPFGERQSLELTFLAPDLKPRKATAPRWGPGGKAFYPHTVQLPEGLEPKTGAVSVLLDLPWSGKIGYLRITGSMDEATQAAFSAALDALKGMEALLLDCRGMGGGSDLPAWSMAGRFFTKNTPNGQGRMLTPAGSWQFDGPIVMLQDETEVSSAETFTWAMSETERVVSVGRPTGGWGIIPAVMELPSGLATLRLGVNNRPTPIRGVRTEGAGWPPDIEIPYGPVFCARADPAREVATEVLRVLHAGFPRRDVAKTYAALFAGDIEGFRKAAAKFGKKLAGWSPDTLAKLVGEDLKTTCALDLALAAGGTTDLPDAVHALARIEKLAAAAKNAGLSAERGALAKAAEKLKQEAAAQEEFLKITDAAFAADAKAAAAFRQRHGKTLIGQYAKTKLWK